MTKKEFAMLAAAMKTYYPRESLLPNDKAMDLWFMQLEDVPYGIAEAALRKWVATERFSPTIADLREKAMEVQGVGMNDWGESWEAVLMAIRRFGRYREREALESMDELTRACVKRLGYGELCMSENIAADRANFRKVYEQLAERKKKDDQIPNGLREMISGLNQKKLEG